MNSPPPLLLGILLILISYVVKGHGCPDTWLDCGNGECVSKMWVCDGENDCKNFKDEENCDENAHKDKCMSTEFQCKDFGCIPMKWRCDGEHDCKDYSDEVNCENETTCDGFRCHDHHCIPLRWRCDGQRDCSDGSDELLCPKTGQPCEEHEFTCSSGSCVDIGKVCDGKPDCIDGSDEGFKCNNVCLNASCEQDCHATPSGIKCLCNEGYELNKDNKTCSDTNECQIDGFCSQLCTNLPGSYKCSCQEGYTIVNQTCLASGDEPLLVFASLKDIRAMKLRSKAYFPIHAAVERATSVDVDPRDSRVYWTEISRNGSSIFSVNIDGTAFRETINHGLLVPEDVAVDYSARNLYVTDSGLKQVLVCKMDGSTCHVLHKVDVNKPRALALDVGDGLLFWSDWGGKPAIYKSYMDGAGRTALVSTNIRWPNGIAIDHAINRIYWCDARLYRIESISLDGTDRKLLLQESVYHPYSLAVFEDTLYWTDWTTFSVETCNKFTGHKQEIIARENGRHIMGVHVYHPVLSRKTENPCWMNLCSHICLIGAAGRHRCACPPGFELLDDQVTCRMSVNSAQIFVTVESSVYHVQPEAAGNNIVTKLPVSKLDSIGDFAYNWEKRAFYISSLIKRSIIEVNMTSMSQRNLVTDHIDAADNLAYDWLGDNLYWTDPSKGTVEVLALKTNSRAVIISNLTETTDMVLAPEKGLLFVSIIGRHPHVSVYDMDGSNRKEIIAVTGLPTCLALHPTNQRLYWCDPRTETISSVNYLKPSNSRKVHTRGVPYVTSIAVSEKFLYWLESASNKLNIMHMDDNRSIYHSTALLDDVPRSAIRKMGYYIPKKGTSACSNNGGCSHICLIKPSGRICQCPAGRKLARDGLTCEVEKVCSANEFRCKKSGKCVPVDYRCDNTPDCDDGSDEDDCGMSSSRCPDGDFRCRNGRCIIDLWKCDSRNDCGDNSDEEGCPLNIKCAEDKFSCENGQCIPTLWRCDGEYDCANGHDEKNCTVNKCKDNEYRCDQGQCIPNSWVCDGAEDCLDGADELKDECKPKTCSKNQFRCDNGVCIDSLLLCDRRNDCEDKSDEKDCERSPKPSTCKKEMFLCDDGNCIYSHEVCDGYQDCSSDESQNCTRRECSESEFYCSSSKRCIPRQWLCDGDPDCTDGADENLVMCYHKSTTSTPRREFSLTCKEYRCDSGDCLPWSKVCDGRPNCRDNSDEGVLCVTSCGKTNGGCSHLCSPSPKGPKCSCLAGYKLLDDLKTCDDENECENPGVCSQFCNNTKGSFKCSCAAGYFLGHDHRTCKADGGAATLVYLLPDQIRGIELSSKFQRVYLQEEQTDMRGLDFDAADGVFYWAEWREGTISRFNIGSKRNEVVVRGLQRPYYLKWDWITKTFYYTDGEGSINACSSQGEFCTSVIISAAPHVNSLELAPQSGVLFWSVWNDVIRKSTALIERSNMDGTGRITILYEKVYWPASLTVDAVLQTLYWADVKLNAVEMSDYHGLNRRVVISDGMYHPFSMTMFEDYIYWADWGSDSIKRCNKFTGQDCMQVNKNNVKSETITVVHKVKQPRGPDPCLNSGCPQMCLQNPTGFSCHCDVHFDSKNGTCVRKPLPPLNRKSPPPECPLNYCKNNGICYTVGQDLRCRCPADTDGLLCEVKERVYDYSWVVVLFLGIGSVAVIVLVIVICRQNRSKIVKLTDSVAVSFRNPRYTFRKRGGLVMDTDDGADADLMLGKKGAYTPSAFGNPLFNQKPYLDPSPGDGDYKRWPSYDSEDSAFVSESQTRDDASLSLVMDQPSMTSKDRIVQFLKKI